MDDLIDASLCLVNLACIGEGNYVLYALYIVTAICNLIRFGAVSIRLAFLIGLTLDCEQLKMIDKTFNWSLANSIVICFCFKPYMQEQYVRWDWNKL